MSVDLIKRAAIARIRDLVLVGELGLADGRPDGIHWKCRNPQRSDRTIGSFVVDIGGSAPGRFKEFASDEGGDIIDLVSYCLAGPGSYQTREARGRAIAWLAQWTGLDDARPGGAGLSPEERRRREEKIAAERAAREEAEFLAREEKSRSASGWWLKQGTPIAGTPVEVYLEKVRGVPLPAVQMTGAIRALGPSVRNPRWAMFSAMARDSKIRAVHLTYLTPDGRKAEVEPVKKMWGDVRGAVVRISKPLGFSPEQMVKRGKTCRVAICEGIEDGLTTAMLYPDWMVWAAGSVSNIAAVAAGGWPACASDIVLIADNDGTGSKGEQAFNRAVQAFLNVSEGRAVRTLKPGDVKDVNDAWRETV